jgi:hypothetical protein
MFLNENLHEKKIQAINGEGDKNTTVCGTTNP